MLERVFAIKIGLLQSKTWTLSNLNQVVYAPWTNQTMSMFQHVPGLQRKAQRQQFILAIGSVTDDRQELLKTRLL